MAGDFYSPRGNIPGWLVILFPLEGIYQGWGLAFIPRTGNISVLRGNKTFLMGNKTELRGNKFFRGHFYSPYRDYMIPPYV
jgi:hypothetical protein